MTSVTIDGETLSLGGFEAVAHGAKVALSPSVLGPVRESRAVVEEHGAGRRLMRFAFRPRLPAMALVILVPFLPLLVTSLLERGWLGVGLASGAVAAFFTGAASTLGSGRRRVLAALERVAAASGGMVLERGRVVRHPVPERVLQPVPEAEVPEPIIGVAGGR